MKLYSRAWDSGAQRSLVFLSICVINIHVMGRHTSVHAAPPRLFLATRRSVGAAE